MVDLAIGLKIILTVMENTPGLMVENIRVNGRTTCSMAKVSTHGKMAENMKEGGKTVSNMELVRILPPAVKRNKDSGKMGKDFIGYKTIIKNDYTTNRMF